MHKKEMIDRLQRWINQRVDPMQLVSVYFKEIFNLPSYYVCACPFHIDENYEKSPLKILKSSKSNYKVNSGSKYHYFYSFECLRCDIKLSGTAFIQKKESISEIDSCFFIINKLNMKLPDYDKKEYENTFGIEFGATQEVINTFDIEQWSHEIMDHQELFNKCINICPQIETINLTTQIRDTNIYSRMKNCLYNHGIINIKQLLDMQKIDFYRIKNMGRKTAGDALILQRCLIIKLASK